VAHVIQEFVFGPIWHSSLYPLARRSPPRPAYVPDNLLLSFRLRARTRIPILLRPLQGHVPSWSVRASGEGCSNRFPNSSSSLQGCAQRVASPVELSRPSPQAARWVADGFNQSPETEAVANREYDQNKGGNFPESRSSLVVSQTKSEMIVMAPFVSLPGRMLCEKCQEVSRELGTFLMAGRRFTQLQSVPLRDMRATRFR